MTGSVFLLAGCSSQPQAGAQRGVQGDMTVGEMEKQVKALIARRNAALASGDEKAWLQGLDTGNTALIKHERMFFANLRGFDFQKLEFVYRNGPLIAEPLKYTKTLPDKTNGFIVRLLTQLRDVDSAVSATEYIYLFAQMDGAFTLVDFGPRTEDDDLVHDNPWDLTPLKVRRAGDVVLVTDGSVGDFERYVGVAARASRAVRKDWGDTPAPDAFALFLTTRAASYRRWFGVDTPAWSEGVEIPLLGVEYSEKYAGSRIVVNLSSPLTRGDPYEVMKHEITHAISNGVQKVDNAYGLSVPRWAVEGFARYIETRESAQSRALNQRVIRDGLARGLFLDDLPDNKKFYEEKYRGFNYSLGWSVFQFIAQARSHETAMKVYLAIAGKGQFDNDQGVDALFGTLYDLGLQKDAFVSKENSRFYQEWTSYLRSL